MDPLLLEKLNVLEQTVQGLVTALESCHNEQLKAQKKLAKLSQENQALRQLVQTAQDQVDGMVGQWFPELNADTKL